MRKTIQKLAIAGSTLFILSTCAVAQKQYVAASANARMHSEHSEFEELPFGKSDVSYGLSVEWHEEIAYWQLGANFMYEPEGAETVNYVITPSLNLLLKDGIWRGGAGALMSYMDMDDPEPGTAVDVEAGEEDSDWTDVYWQLIFGVHVPLFGLEFDAHAFYPFEKWNRLEDFDFDDIDYGVSLGVNF